MLASSLHTHTHPNNKNKNNNNKNKQTTTTWEIGQSDMEAPIQACLSVNKGHSNSPEIFETLLIPN